MFAKVGRELEDLIEGSQRGLPTYLYETTSVFFAAKPQGGGLLISAASTSMAGGLSWHVDSPYNARNAVFQDADSTLDDFGGLELERAMVHSLEDSHVVHHLVDTTRASNLKSCTGNSKGAGVSRESECECMA